MYNRNKIIIVLICVIIMLSSILTFKILNQNNTSNSSKIDTTSTTVKNIIIDNTSSLQEGTNTSTYTYDKYINENDNSMEIISTIISLIICFFILRPLLRNLGLLKSSLIMSAISIISSLITGSSIIFTAGIVICILSLLQVFVSNFVSLWIINRYFLESNLIVYILGLIIAGIASVIIAIPFMMVITKYLIGNIVFNSIV